MSRRPTAPSARRLSRASKKVRSALGEAGRRLGAPAARRSLSRTKAAVIGLGRVGLIAILRVAAVLEWALVPVLRPIGRLLVAVAAGLDRGLGPERGAAAVAVAGFGILAYSQFTDFRGVAIGERHYEGVAPLTDAPMAETWTAWSAHGPAVLLLGLAALGAVTLAVFGRRRARVAASVATAASVGALAVVLAIDLPAVGDHAELDMLYASVDGVLLGGFYTQLAGAATLLGVAVLPFIWTLARPGGPR